MSDCHCQFEAKNREQRQVLGILFATNTIMFIIGILAGTIARSTALVADSLDMFADAAVFGISLYAIGRSRAKKIHAAFLAGIFQTTLATLVIGEVVRRAFWGSEPESGWMMGIAFLSLLVNCSGMVLMAKYRHDEIHMRSSWLFLSNDAIANFGVILAGFLVSLFRSRFPDLIIGAIIAIIVLLGGIQILQDARNEGREGTRPIEG